MIKDEQIFIENTFIKLNAIPAAAWSIKPSADKWSKKEILGHLIDSAMSNLRRLIVSQYEAHPKIGYRQNEWVNIQNYQNTDIDQIIQLWRLINLQYIRVASNLSPEALRLHCDTGKDSIELHSLSFLIEDYFVHMRHHLNQLGILN